MKKVLLIIFSLFLGGCYSQGTISEDRSIINSNSGPKAFLNYCMTKIIVFTKKLKLSRLEKKLQIIEWIESSIFPLFDIKHLHLQIYSQGPCKSFWGI